jgi:CheY-like chemotaxis protein
VLLLDLAMPEMDGVEVLRTLRERGCPARAIAPKRSRSPLAGAD